MVRVAHDSAPNGHATAFEKINTLTQLVSLMARNPAPPEQDDAKIEAFIGELYAEALEDGPTS